MSGRLYFRVVLARIKRPKDVLHPHDEVSLENFMSYGLGSDDNGRVLSEAPCSNISGRGITLRRCPGRGLQTCSQCCLVKYCSETCQQQHWTKHRLDCENSLLNPGWQPSWVVDGREPLFHHRTSTQTRPPNRLWSGISSYDCLQLQYNEGYNKAVDLNLALCFADIRNLVKTVNSLPKDYRGQCNILVNNADSVITNRNLLILFALLSPGPSIEESAELAAHLMYSSALSHKGAAYLRRCGHLVYGDGVPDGNMTFQCSLDIRGKGSLHSMQTSMGIKRPMEMFFSTYELEPALQSMHEVLISPLHDDDRHRILFPLKPSHRLAMERFWQTGILAPFSLDLSVFTQPNRLLFSAQGKWLGHSTDNPLQGWNIPSVQASGQRYGYEAAADIFGCLFVHVKQELREFASRMKEYNISIHITQYDPFILSKGLSIGLIPAFQEAPFDRIDLGDAIDCGGANEGLVNWGPLLNKDNRCASILMHSKIWYRDHPSAVARFNPKVLGILIERSRGVPSMASPMEKVLVQGPHSPSLLRLIDSIDAFLDHEGMFLEYIRDQGIDESAEMSGLQMRATNRVHPKRFGIPLYRPRQNLPDLTKQEFYDLYILGGADIPVRFIEFENAPAN